MINKINKLRYFIKGDALPLSKAHMGAELGVAVGVLCVALLVSGCVSTRGVLDAPRLGVAVAMDDARYVQRLMASNAITADQAIPGTGYSSTPMITVAARHASINVLRYLIAAKADLNARTPDRDTPLMLATMFGKEEAALNNDAYSRYDLAVRLLVEAGASLENTGTTAYTPLSYAAYAGRDGALRYLLEKGAKVNANADTQSRTSNMNTPLMMAAMQGHRNASLLLLRAGADANVRVPNGMSALRWAEKNKHTNLVQMLRCAESLQPGETFRQRCE